jgi:2-methylcitrate synthase
VRDRLTLTTAISEVGTDPDRLTYRGYAIADLAAGAGFEEVAFLQLRGRLPDREELLAYRSRLRAFRPLPAVVVKVLEHIPPSNDPLAAMVALRTGISSLGTHLSDAPDAADRLIAWIPGMLAYWQRLSSAGDCSSMASAEPTTAGHLLSLIRGPNVEPLAREFLDASLVLYSDLAFNASTLACRVCASTGADLTACITAAIATLGGPLHGGASASVARLLEAFQDPEQARLGVRDRLARHKRIPGFGHAVFRQDPRTPIFKSWARRLDNGRGRFDVAEAVEDAMRAQKGLTANVDFYAACCYRSIGLPVTMFAPLFVASRIAGWAAHVAEQLDCKTLIHPHAAYDGHPARPIPSLDERERGDPGSIVSHER